MSITIGGKTLFGRERKKGINTPQHDKTSTRAFDKKKETNVVSVYCLKGLEKFHVGNSEAAYDVRLAKSLLLE